MPWKVIATNRPPASQRPLAGAPEPRNPGLALRLVPTRSPCVYSFTSGEGPRLTQKTLAKKFEFPIRFNEASKVMKKKKKTLSSRAVRRELSVCAMAAGGFRRPGHRGQRGPRDQRQSGGPRLSAPRKPFESLRSAEAFGKPGHPRTAPLCTAFLTCAYLFKVSVWKKVHKVISRMLEENEKYRLRLKCQQLSSESPLPVQHEGTVASVLRVTERWDPKGRAHRAVVAARGWAVGPREPLVEGTVTQDEWSGAPLRTREAQGAGLGVAGVADWASGTLSSRRQWRCELSVCAMAVLRNRRGLWGSELTSRRGPSKAGELGACLLRHQAFQKPPARLLKGLVHQRTGTQLSRDRKRKRAERARRASPLCFTALFWEIFRGGAFSQ
ncbi:hypothetical protein QTO34_016346 [Cnephaeus nilssonii]|uniref:Uncharacterized protein n=1 Tax=Cnephaeus nilssonii TaxID=3371016 RepID=A0AA40I6I7_CNENI|nr:hypothetical protein QTO34_016346 [Eptesicus nilssonii]